MVFSSTVFLFFFLPLVLLIYYNPFFTGRGFRNTFLFWASIVFYAWGEPLFVFLMLFSILVGWFIGKKLNVVAEDKRKLYLALGILFHVGILFIFKYLSFTAQQIGLLLNTDALSINIALPIGISFFTFQLLSYEFDIYYGWAKAQKSILNVGLYIALFPQLIAGPIVRYNTVEEQILQREESLNQFVDGVERFIYGLAKKVLIANYAAQIADNLFDTNASLSIATAWLGAVAYTLQIYFDFSGYSDMAIGLGKMFGFSFPENFNYPYIARSATEFWRRWHISLGTWFRDYVYIPLGGNRVTKERWIINIFVVWLLTGFWHGANWTFLCWGLFYFILLLLENITGFDKKLGRLSHLYAILVIILGWTMFRSTNISKGLQYIGMMFGADSSGLWDDVFIYYISNSYVILLAGIIFSCPILLKLRTMKYFSRLEPVLLIALFLVTLVNVVGSSYNPFIYFNF